MKIQVMVMLLMIMGAQNTYSEDEKQKCEAISDLLSNDVIMPTTKFWSQGSKGRVPVNVEAFGAVGDGVTDDTQAFRDAWDKACSLNNAVFLVPEHRRYKVNATRFRGPCGDRLLVQVSGTIVAPEEPEDWDPTNPRTWLHFSNLSGVRIQGGGVIDGSGSKWWASSCKINKTNPCKAAPTALTIDLSTGVRVKGITVQSAQQMHFTVSRSEAIRITGVRVRSPRDSPNTDGIHIGESTNVVIQNCKIGTGDDCISIVNASSKIKMKNIDCGPGHGISIGSLGKDNSTAAVTGIVLDTATLTGTTNGLRIKTWQGGSGYVRSVRFENVKMSDVENPIIIDQFYCDSPVSCKNQTSAVKISQVIYRNISGTSKNSKAMKFACSDTVPCSGIVLNNINLERENGSLETFCNCAMGFDFGVVRPAADCLKNDKNSRCDANSQDSDQKLIHTEL
ncbi:uncharacterized protein A4U43_C06F5500 [Asparagus officinalis]|uniref:endo-polygalacturonase n=1 Tax=Asparagus officinalis TaxID=4686 RepID=A0A5P1EKL1_ASPOF|nr:probable polygalacturonase At1g80170 [Asparagus officinalis]ONK66223.1 uncharacterized protein A4U43_C06F5500 [Asparagus officinalis]